MTIRRILVLCAILLSRGASAGVFETSAGYSYQKSTYGLGSYTTSESYSLSLGYYFTQDSEVQFSYQDTHNHELVPSVQDIEYRDQVYSLNFVYHLMGEASMFRPYFRFGVGQLNRDATGSYAGGYSPPGRLDQVTVIGGLGLKARFSSHIGLKLEATSYLSGGSISSWRDNFNCSIGGSYYF
jgi:OprF membrane domain